MRLRSLSRPSIFLLTILVPLNTFAAGSVADALATPDIRPVTRGDFVRAAVKLFAIPLPGMRESTMAGVQPRWKQYVKAAKDAGALVVFGVDAGSGTTIAADLTQTITRGEALSMVTILKHLSPDRIVSFNDVAKGSLMESAVSVAIQESWMLPTSKLVFGVNRTLDGATARLLLRKIVGEQLPDPTQTVDPGVRERVVIDVPTAPSAQDMPKEDIFREVWNLLIQQYMRRDDIDANDAAYKALEAMVDSLNDPYTVFYRPVAAEQFQSQLEGEITGIGVSADFQSDALVVVTPLTGSPAEKAGVKAGDRIIEVDGISLKGSDMTKAISLVRGKKGTTVKLVIQRGDMTFDLSIVRDVIVIPEITVKWQDKVAVVNISQFGEITGRDIRGTLTEIQKQKPTGIILDLRNNPGGLLDVANEVTSNFLPQDSLMASIATHSSTFEERTLAEPSVDPSVKVAVLMNKGSASASEIVAGALQDSKRAFIVGEQSFGKGVVQNVNTLSDGSILKVTIAEWITPGGNHIDKKGITPDVKVENREGGRDDQLLEALKLLK